MFVFSTKKCSPSINTWRKYNLGEFKMVHITHGYSQPPLMCMELHLLHDHTALLRPCHNRCHATYAVKTNSWCLICDHSHPKWSLLAWPLILTGQTSPHTWGPNFNEVRSLPSPQRTPWLWQWLPKCLICTPEESFAQENQGGGGGGLLGGFIASNAWGDNTTLVHSFSHPLWNGIFQ